MHNKQMYKTAAVLAAPILLFFLLLIPYSWLNKAFIVEWFGCGCPKVDAFGNILSPDFNANDFTALFWAFIALCTTGIAAFLSKRIPKIWLRIVYVVCMLAVSLLIAYQFCRVMMWN